MKQISAMLTICVMIAVAPASTIAQDGTRVGLGLGVTNDVAVPNLFDDYADGPFMNTISVPITGARFRIEPVIGLFRYTASDDDVDITVSRIQVGTGIFGLKRSGSTIFYYGGRVGMMRNSMKLDSGFIDDEQTLTDLYFAPTAGAEYLFGNTFSLGGEVQLVYTRFGEDDAESSIEGDFSSSAIHTKTVFFVRWHF